MSQRWPMVSLSEVARPVIRTIRVVPGQSYRTIGVKWWGEGAYERQTIDGSETAAKVLSLVKRDDLIINKIWVRHGSTAVATETVDGCAASNEFPTFELDPEKTIPRWLHWLTKTKDFWTKCDHLSMGTSGKNRIKPERFLTIEIPLPPLEEQRQLVTKIDELATKIEETKRLRTEGQEQLEALARSTLSKLISAATATRPLVDVIQPGSTISYGVLVPGGDEPEGVPFVRIQDLHPSSPPVKPSKKIARNIDAQYARTRLQGNEILVAVVGATIGKIGIVPPAWVGANIARAVCRIIPGPSVTREFLIAVLRSQEVQGYFREATRTLAQPTLNVGQLEQTPIPVVPLDQQQEILGQLNKIESALHSCRQLQATTMDELDALMPAILDRAFKGEL